jgi:hypothetical protein
MDCKKVALPGARHQYPLAMGLSVDSVRFLMQSWKAGVRFQETLTLGRQSMFPSAQRLERLLQEFGAWPPPQGAEQFHRELASATWRFEIFVRALGAKTVESCDASGYEGATRVHDLNEPIPDDWEERYDVVLDGGTLEHVFNFPVAIASCMKMVKVGGHLIIFTPCNNYCGHGFYQFSPELFYRVLSPENGFQVERMVALEDNLGASTVLGAPYAFQIAGPWHEVNDPAKVGQRVTLANRNSSIVMVLARRVAKKPIFQKTPQQSDYVPLWQQDAPPNPTVGTRTGNRLVAWLRASLPESVCKEVIPRLAILVDPFRLWKDRRRHSFRNRQNYRRVRE